MYIKQHLSICSICCQKLLDKYKGWTIVGLYIREGGAAGKMLMKATNGIIKPLFLEIFAANIS